MSVLGNSPPVWRGGRHSLTGWLCRVCTRPFPSCEGEMSGTDTLGCRGVSALGNSPPVEGRCLVQIHWGVEKVCAANSPPVEGWQAQPDGVVASCLHRLISPTTGRTDPLIYPPAIYCISIQYCLPFDSWK